MTPEQIKIERIQIESRLAALKRERDEIEKKMEAADGLIEIAKKKMTKLRSSCTHSYAEKKAAGVHWHELGFCEYCGESDY